MKIVSYVYNTLSRWARRIKQFMRDAYSAIFTLAVSGIFALLAVVSIPLFNGGSTWFNIQVAFSRLLVASPLILFLVVISWFIARQMSRIDKKKDEAFLDLADKKFESTIKRVMNERTDGAKTDAIANKLGVTKWDIEKAKNPKE